MKYPCMEATADYEFQHIRIRLWIDVKEVPSNAFQSPDYGQAWIPGEFALTRDAYFPGIIASIVDRVPNVSAVQVIDKESGVGAVVYTVPFTDPHG